MAAANVARRVGGGDLGIDTVRLGGAGRRESGAQFVPGWSVSGVIDESGEAVVRGMMRKLACGATLSLMKAPDALYGFVEGSLPKVAGVDNVVPLGLEESRLPAARMLEEAREFFDFDHINVNRLDVARDFTGCDDVGPLLLGLSSVPLPGRKVRDLYRDPAHGHAQTLFVRNGGGGCRLYDKFEESKQESAIGRLRCEGQERRRGLRALGLERWENVTSSDVEAVGRQRFEWAGFDRVVSVRHEAVARLLAAPDLTDGQRLQALGALLLAQVGSWDRVGDRNRRSRMRRILDEVGAFACDEVERTYRLDYDLGLQAA